MPRQSVATFRVDYLQVLDEAGKADPELEPAIPAEDLRRLYQTMLQTRLLDRRMYKLQQQGRIGTFAGVEGQEAGCLGAAYALRSQDWLIPSYRETSALLWRGVPLRTLLTYFQGLEEGNAFPPEANVLPIVITIAGQTLHAAGIAWAAKVRGDDVMSLVFIGDGATSEGDFHEACNLAGVFQLPLVIFCVNNQFAISCPRSRQTRAETLAQKAIGYGIHGLQIDGNDVLGAYVATQEAVQRARAGQGPTLIESLTYRMGPHTTADDPRRYRTEAEVAEWRAKDPLERFRKYLEAKGLWSRAWQEHLEADSNLQIEEAIGEAEEALAHIEPLEMFQHVYEEIPPHLQEQREEAARSTEAAVVAEHR